MNNVEHVEIGRSLFCYGGYVKTMDLPLQGSKRREKERKRGTVFFTTQVFLVCVELLKTGKELVGELSIHSAYLFRSFCFYGVHLSLVVLSLLIGSGLWGPIHTGPPCPTVFPSVTIDLFLRLWECSRNP